MGLPGGQSEGIRAPRGRVELGGAAVVLVGTGGAVEGGGGEGVEGGEGSTTGVGVAAAVEAGAVATDESGDAGGCRATLCVVGVAAGAACGGAADWSALRAPATVVTGALAAGVAAGVGADSKLGAGASVVGVVLVVELCRTM
jgi:hypothetical protein